MHGGWLSNIGLVEQKQGNWRHLFKLEILLFLIVWEAEEAHCAPEYPGPKNGSEQERQQNLPWARTSMGPAVLPTKQQIPVANGRDGEEGVPHNKLLHELENVS